MSDEKDAVRRMSDKRMACMNCCHWRGDREEARLVLERARENGLVETALRPDTGWMPRGDCAELRIHEIVEIGIPETPAGFFCWFFERKATEEGFNDGD